MTSRGRNFAEENIPVMRPESCSLRVPFEYPKFAGKGAHWNPISFKMHMWIGATPFDRLGTAGYRLVGDDES